MSPSQQRLLQLTLYVRVALGAVGAVFVWLLPAEPSGTRRTYLLMTLGAYLPYAAAIYAARTRLRSGLWSLTAIGDLAFVLAFMLLVPQARYAALMGSLLIVAFYTAFAGPVVGGAVAAAAILIVQVARLLLAAEDRIDAYTLSMHAVIAISMTLVVEAATRERRRTIVRQLGAKNAAVFHELGLPLIAVAGFTETLLQRWPEMGDAERRRMVAAITSSVEEALRRSEALKGISLVEAPLYPQHVEIAGFIRSFLERYEPAFRGHELAVSASLPHVVAADVAALESVVGNLLLNAWKHSEPGSPIQIAVDRPDGRIVVTISNQAARDATRDDVALYRPGGRGLAISRAYLERMGGTLTIERAERRVIVAFTLPAGPPAGAPRSPAQDPSRAQPP